MSDTVMRVEDEDIVTTWREDAKGLAPGADGHRGRPGQDADGTDDSVDGTDGRPAAATATATPPAPTCTRRRDRWRQRRPVTPAIERRAGDPRRSSATTGPRPAAAPRGRARGFDDLLSLDDVDRILATSAPRVPAFRMVKDGRPPPPSAYTKSGRVGLGSWTTPG